MGTPDATYLRAVDAVCDLAPSQILDLALSSCTIWPDVVEVSDAERRAWELLAKQVEELRDRTRALEEGTI